MPAEHNNHIRNNNATSNLDPYHHPLAPRHDNSPMTGPQRAPTPYPSHLQALEERFMAEFLDEGGFQYPFVPPLSNITRRPFLISGPPDSSNSDTVVLHQFPGPLEVPPTSEATTGSYHIAPAQVFPSLLPINTSSSPNPDSPLAVLTDSPSMLPLASDVSDNGSLDHAPNLQLLASVSEYITASERHSSDPQKFVVYIQDVDPLEHVLPYFPGAYATTITQPPMDVPIDSNPVFGLQQNSLDKEWEENTWEYLLTRDDNLLESFWALLQDIKDPGVANERRNSFVHKEKWTNVELSFEPPTWRKNLNNMNSPSSLPLLWPCPTVFVSVLNVRLMVICRVNVGIGCFPSADSCTLTINSAPPPTFNLDSFPAPPMNPDTYKNIVLNGNSKQ
ncbi:uncharacterized protein FIBRA_09284 [Fibroporia radiculosa]|uniref:Uncharacterized protein n=1 Tax=Fibroporia radiculosa TaxID=599839 RepID=J7RVP2_9APHY|nr:uncharacterized protein FIBRA_09284 [Fibroporia radiculosa]CCM06970.1 predicted protein [Fibroporia radiculosa]